MTFKPETWYPIAVGLCILNVVAAWFTGGAWHATIHAALAAGFGVWSQRLRRPSGGREVEAGLEAIELDMEELRQQLGEAQERLDFAERVLAKEPAPRQGKAPGS